MSRRSLHFLPSTGMMIAAMNTQLWKVAEEDRKARARVSEENGLRGRHETKPANRGENAWTKWTGEVRASMPKSQDEAQSSSWSKVTEGATGSNMGIESKFRLE